MMKQIFRLTLLTAYRSRYLTAFAMAILLAFLISAINNMLVIKAREQQFEKARDEVRHAWLNQGPQNPHNSAHYGHYVFRPVYGVQALDNGIAPYAGGILRLEAHAQHEPAFSPAQLRTESARMGEISFSWLLQFLMPLFIILLCFNAVSADREQETLKMILAQGISTRSYLLGKILSYFLIVATLALVGWGIQWVVMSIISDSVFQVQDLYHGLVWLAIYLIYFLILISLSVCVSAWSSGSRNSLLVQVSAWTFFLVIIPRLAANLGSRLFPMEQRTAFNAALREDREKGIDGHNPEDARYKKFEDSLLRHYKVDSLTQLPVNADGLIMQADEEYANIIYDKHFERIHDVVRKQNSISRYAAAINPFLAIRNLSMGVSQSDFHHHMSFLRDAEDYRRYLIHNLNSKMAYGGSKTGDWDWKTDPTYWSEVRDFDYKRPALGWSLAHYRLEWTMLFMWLLLSLLLVAQTARNLKII